MLSPKLTLSLCTYHVLPYTESAGLPQLLLRPALLDCNLLGDTIWYIVSMSLTLSSTVLSKYLLSERINPQVSLNTVHLGLVAALLTFGTG